jgi:hypothetical protein
VLRAIVAVVLVLAASSGALAQAQGGSEPQSGERARPVPDYDNREDPPPSVDEVLLWVPRVLFFPLHLVFEYVLRRPLVAFIDLAERQKWDVVLIDFFTWREREAGIVPTAFYELGLIPNAGIYFFWNDLFVRGNRFRLHAGFGGTDFVTVSIRDSLDLDPRTELSIIGDAERRPDHVFQGRGYDTYALDKARYIRTRFEARLRLRIRPWRASELRLDAILSDNAFDANGYGLSSEDPPLAEHLANGRLIEPPGFDGYVAYRQRLGLVFDTREPRPAPRHGVRLAAFGELAFDLSRLPDRRWVRYGGSAAGFVDLGSERVVSLSVETELADPLGEEEVPFTEQPMLAGQSLASFAGFLRRQLVGESLFVFTLQYTYPIWVELDAGFHLSVGNVFAPRFEDFVLERLRISWGFSIRTIDEPDHGFHLAIAFGTTPIIAGASLDSIRFVVGGAIGDP